MQICYFCAEQNLGTMLAARCFGYSLRDTIDACCAVLGILLMLASRRATKASIASKNPQKQQYQQHQ